MSDDFYFRTTVLEMTQNRWGKFLFPAQRRELNLEELHWTYVVGQGEALQASSMLIHVPGPLCSSVLLE